MTDPIDLGNGLRVRTFEPPPAGFNPLEAEHDALVHHGFPHKPRDPELRRLWEWALRRPLRYVVPEFGVPEGGRRSLPVEDTVTSNNWSGAAVHEPYALVEPVTNVVGAWNVPVSAAGPSDGADYYCSQWVGISNGGTGSEAVLFQAGTESDITAGSGKRNIYAWWEWVPGSPDLPAGAIPIKNIPIEMGDQVVCALGSTPETSEGIVWFFDLTQGVGTSFNVDGSPLALHGVSAEWIVERPTVAQPNVLGPLADYVYVGFTNCSALAGDGKARLDLASPSVQAIDMLNPQGKLMSQATITGPSSVNCTWSGVYE